MARTEGTGRERIPIRITARRVGRTPTEAGLSLIRRPRKPTYLPAYAITYGLPDVPASWRDYLYWND